MSLPLVGSSINSPAFAQDLFWVGGNGLWGDSGSWTTDPSLPGPAGPPNGNSEVHFEGLTSPALVKFDADGMAHRFVVSDGDVTFDLSGHDLDGVGRLVGSPPNTAVVGPGLEVIPGAGEKAVLLLQDGTGDSGHVQVVSPTGAAASLTIESDMSWTIFGNSDPVTSLTWGDLHVLGSEASLTIRGAVTQTGGSIPNLTRISSNGTATVNGGVLQSNGKLLVGEDVGGGQLTITNGGFVNYQQDVTIGESVQGNVDVSSTTNQSTLVTGATTTLGDTTIGSGDVSLVGSNSVWTANGNVNVGNFGIGRLNLSSGARVSVDTSDTSVGTESSGDGRISVGDGSLFESQGSVYVGGSNTAAGGDGVLRVLAGGEATVDGTLRFWSSGSLDMDGGAITATSVRIDSSAAFADFDSGQLTVDGGTFVADSNLFGFGSAAGTPVIRLVNGASASVINWEIGDTDGGSAEVIVLNSGIAGGVNATGDVRVGTFSAPGQGTLTILDGGKVSANDDVTIAHSTGTQSDVTVQGVGTDGRRSLLRTTAQATDEEIQIGRRGTATLDVRNGGLVQSLNDVSIASFAGSQGTATVGGIQGGIKAAISASDELAVGGFATTDQAGGTALLTVETDGEVIVGDRSKIYGDGTVDVQFGGLLRTNRLHLAGGTLSVAGLVEIGGSIPPGNQNGCLCVAAAGEVIMESGTLTAGDLIVESGATLSFTGGRLSVVSFQGDLTQDGGTLAPGNSPGVTTVTGDYTINAGTFEVEIGGPLQGTDYDFLDVTGDVDLAGGALDVSLIAPFTLGGSQQFDVLSVGGTLTGTFAGLAEGALVDSFGGTDLFITYGAGDGNDVALFTAVAGLPGDYNNNGIVDAADYTVWRDLLGAPAGTLPNDVDGGLIGPAQYATWKANFGMTQASPGSANSTSVPEPAAALLMMLAATGAAARLGGRCVKSR